MVSPDSRTSPAAVSMNVWISPCALRIKMVIVSPFQRQACSRQYPEPEERRVLWHVPYPLLEPLCAMMLVLFQPTGDTPYPIPTVFTRTSSSFRLGVELDACSKT